MPPVVPPAGLTPAATFVPTAVTGSPVPAVLLAREIDPTTGEWTSLFKSRPPVVALLLEQLRVVRGSGASVADSGNGLSTIKYNDASAAARVTAEMHRILDPLIRAKQIQLVGNLEVEAGEESGDLGAVAFRFRDLVSPAPGQTTYTVMRTPDGQVDITQDAP